MMGEEVRFSNHFPGKVSMPKTSTHTVKKNVHAGKTASVSQPAVETLLSSLADDNPEVRQDARRELVRMGHGVVRPLLGQLRSPESNVRWEAAKALSEMHDTRAAEGLAIALSDDDSDVRWLAAEGLVALGRDALKPLFLELIRNSDSSWVREGAGHILHAFRDSSADSVAGPVLAALENRAPIFNVPVAAFSALGKLHDQDERDQIHHFMPYPPVPKQR